MDVLSAVATYKENNGVPPYEECLHPAIAVHTQPFLMQIPTSFLPWDNRGGVIALRRKDAQLAICRCGVVLAGKYFHLERSHDEETKDEDHQKQIAIALKVMDRSQVILQQDDMENEIRIMAQLQIGGVDAPLCNPHTIRWEQGADLHNLYIATEFISNGSFVSYAHKKIRILMLKHLQQFVAKYGQGPTKLECISYVYRDAGYEWMRESLTIFHGLMKGLAYVHAQNIAHLDFDIYNIAIDRHGVPRIIDLGSSQIMDHRGRVGGGDIGIKCKPLFVAPEVREHSKLEPPRPGFDGASADLWAADVIVH